MPPKRRLYRLSISHNCPNPEPVGIFHTLLYCLTSWVSLYVYNKSLFGEMIVFMVVFVFSLKRALVSCCLSEKKMTRFTLILFLCILRNKTGILKQSTFSRGHKIGKLPKMPHHLVPGLPFFLSSMCYTANHTWVSIIKKSISLSSSFPQSICLPKYIINHLAKEEHIPQTCLRRWSTFTLFL